MADSALSDEEIIAKVLSGDTNAYRAVVGRYQGLVFSIGMRFFRNEDDASDYSQEVFVRAFKSLSSFKAKAPFRYWLSKLAYNNAISRKSVRRVVTESFASDDNPSGERSACTEYERSEVKSILLAAISELPEEYRICIDLYFFGGLSYSEISMITGFPVGTIKSYVFRAKKILRDSLKGTIAEEYNEM